MIYNEDQYKDKIRKSLIDSFDIETPTKRINVTDVDFKPVNRNPVSWKDINSAIKNRETIGMPVVAKIEVTDKETGEVLSKTKTTVGIAPVMTKLNSYVVNGTQYNMPIQFRLKAGAYPRRNESGDVEVFNNVTHASPFRTLVDPASKKVTLKIRQGKVPLYPILKILGESDSDIAQVFGGDLYDKNKVYKDSDITKIYKAIYKRPPESLEAAEIGIIDHFAKMETDPEVNLKTINNDHSSVDGRYLLDTVSAAKDIIRGNGDGVNRNSMPFKKVIGVDDIVSEGIAKDIKSWNFAGNIKRKLNRSDDVRKVIDSNKTRKIFEAPFTVSNISRYSPQSNLAAIENAPYLTTLIGPGGISSEVSVPEDAKTLQNTNMGFLDANHTPESSHAGITLTMSLNTIRDGDQIKSKVVDVKTGEELYLSPKELYDEPLAFANEFRYSHGKWIAKKGKTHVVYQDKMDVVDSFLVKYMIPDATDMFDISSNLVPFMNSNQGNRGMTSAKMAEQSVSLLNPEKPLVEPLSGGRSLLDEIGEKYSVKAKEDGIVVNMTKDYIAVKEGDGIKKYELFNDLPLNDNSFLESRLRVKEGDKVVRGQILADSNHTVDGKYSPGVNLNTAYIPWKGWNFEDGIVITEDAAKKLTSKSMYKITIPNSETMVNNLDKYVSYNPYGIKRDDLRRYEGDGTIRIGERVKPGEILSANIAKNVLTGADTIIAKIKKSAVEPYKDKSVMWSHEESGEIVDKVKHKDGTDIYIKTIEEFKPGDKIVARHGNKGIVAKIIPTAMAPLTENGEKVEVILDPHGVVPRINIGQVLETAAGKIAKKTGKTYYVNNFADVDYRDIIENQLIEHGLKDKENIYDPESGVTIPNIAAGNMYFTKLKHPVRKKISARGLTDPYTYNDQPMSGKGLGGQSIDKLTMNALLAYNPRNLMREMMSVKNNRNTDYWRDVQHGEIPSAPGNSYEYGKFKSLLQSMGVNTIDNGSTLKLSPLTDREIREMSDGEILDPTKTFRGKGIGLTPDKKGLFGDQSGGMRGNHFNHIELNDRIVSPAYKETIKSLLHLTEKQFEEMIK